MIRPHPPETPVAARPARPNEVKYYGVHACLTLFKCRPQDIIKAYLVSSLIPTFSSCLKWCAAHKKAYRIVEAAELHKLTDSVHHEGICLLARELQPLSFDEFQVSPLLSTSMTCLLYLDGVQNPHNMGSILRVAAHFGIPFVLGDATTLPRLSPSAYRIAKGGADSVRLVSLVRPLQALRWLRKQGFSVVATSSHQGTPLYQHSFDKKTLLAVGSETEGVSKTISEQADDFLQIPGTGQVESLNVSIASALCLGEYWRQKSVGQKPHA